VTEEKKHTFPLLNTEEAEEIVSELGSALDAHRDWTEKFRTMLVCRTKPKAIYLNADSHKKTVFGRWYSGKVNPLLRNHPEFAAVGKLSERMHGLARGLACTIRDGKAVKPAQYKAFVESAFCFQVNVRKLLSEAWDFLRYTDPLTGVMTRAIMEARLEEERERIRRNKQSCSVGMMDLDHFKKVNDTYGHQAGDKVLKAVAGYILNHLRRYDQVFRYGGEEFVLLLPNTKTAKAREVLDRLRQNINRHAIKISDDKNLNVSASFGIAELLADNSIKTSIERADQALYAAKGAGRNQVRIWQADKTPLSGKK